MELSVFFAIVSGMLIGVSWIVVGSLRDWCQIRLEHRRRRLPFSMLERAGIGVFNPRGVRRFGKDGVRE